MAKPLGLTRNIAIMSATASVWTLGNTLWIFQLPLFFSSLGASPFLIGVIYGLGEAVHALAGLASGQLADRFGRKRVLALAAGLRVASLVVLTLGLAMSNLVGFLSGFMLYNVSAAVYMPARQVLLAESASKQAAGTSISTFYTIQAIPGIAGPAVGGVIVGWASREQVFVVAGLLAASVAIAWQLLLQETMPQVDSKGSRRSSFLDAFSRLKVLTVRSSSLSTVIFSSLLVAAGASMIAFLIPLYAKERLGFTGVDIGFMYSAYLATVALITLPIGRIGDRLGMTKMRAGLWFFEAALLLVPLLVVKHPVALGALAMWLALSDSGRPIGVAWLERFSSPEVRGLAFGALYSAGAFFGIIGAGLGGFLFTVNPATPILTGCVLTALGAALALRLLPKEFQAKRLI